ncbi:MAG: TIGR00725 family protein [Candidatus Altarchaeaceae archaeon]
MKRIIAVIGRENIDDERIKNIAYKIGKEIARNNCVLLCGGKGGIMEEACKGAKEENGITIGILPSLNKEEANKYVDIPLATGIGYTRNAIIAASADVLISINGKEGTLSEIAFAMNFKKPIIRIKNTGGASDLNLELINYPYLYDVDENEAVNFALKILQEKEGFLELSWNDIERMCKKLKEKINFDADIIVGISRGGLVPARILSDLLDIKNLEIIKIESYTGIGTKKEPKITRELLIDIKDKNVLLVDDVADTGESLILAKEYLLKKFPKNLKIATLHYKPKSKIIPDYYVEETEKWIIYPWEKNETIKEIRK